MSVLSGFPRPGDDDDARRREVDARVEEMLSSPEALMEGLARTDAARFDVQRENAASHLAFGFGRHFCLGAHLARMEIRALFKELLPRLEHIELAGEPTWIKAYFVQGPKRVPISYRMR